MAALVLYSKAEKQQLRCWFLGTRVDEFDALESCLAYMLSMEQASTIDIISQRRISGSLIIQSSSCADQIRTTIADLPVEILLQIRSSIFKMTLDQIHRHLRSCGDIKPEKRRGLTKLEDIWTVASPSWSEWLQITHMPKFLRERRASGVINTCLFRFGCTAIFNQLDKKPTGPYPLIITHLPKSANWTRPMGGARSRFCLLEYLRGYHELPFPTVQQGATYQTMFRTLLLSPAEIGELVPTAVYISHDEVFDLYYLPS